MIFQRKYAFVDEFGTFGYQFDKPGVSTHFIVTAIIVEDKDINNLYQAVEDIRRRHFQTGEIKSSNIAGNHRRRIKILNEIKSLPFNAYILVCDKQAINEESGLMYEGPFYKYINRLLYSDLQFSFRSISIYADAREGKRWRTSFKEYVQKQQEKQQLELWDEYDFHLEESKRNVLVQLADLVGGSIAYSYDVVKKNNAEGNNYVSLLKDKILQIRHFPETFDPYQTAKDTPRKGWDPLIANICYRKALQFIKVNEGTSEDETKQQIIVLRHLLFRFMNYDSNKYISTNELISHLAYRGYPSITTQNFRMKIIARLRDEGVILASSKTGYKIPTNEGEIYDFINHGKTIIMPMLSRLRKCHDIIKLGTNGAIDLFEKAEYKQIATMLDSEDIKEV